MTDVGTKQKTGSVALLALIALFFTNRIPVEPPGTTGRRSGWTS